MIFIVGFNICSWLTNTSIMSHRHLNLVQISRQKHMPSQFLLLFVLLLPFSAIAAEPQFTDEELSYLRDKKEILMCVDPNWMPYEKIENGKHIGMTYDYIRLFSDRIGLPITLVPTTTWTQSLEYAKSRKCDIFSLAMSTPERTQYMTFTKPYLSIPLVVATRLDKLFIADITNVTSKRLGIVKGYAFVELLRNKYPKINLIEVPSLDEGLAQVATGELYGFVGALSSVGYSIQRDFIGELKVAGKFDEKWELSVGVRNDSPMLLSAFEKIITSVDHATKQEIMSKWISIKFDKGTDYQLVWKIVFGSLLLLTIFMVWNRTLKSEVNARKISEARFRALFEQMPSGVAVYEAVDNGDDFIFKDLNRAAEKIDNIKREELIGKRVTEAFPGVEELGLFGVFKHVWQSGKAEELLDGSYNDDNTIEVWRDNRVYKLPSGDIVTVYDDITNRKQAEVQNALISTVYENTSEAIVIADSNSRIIDCNRAYSEITGYSLEEVKGKNPSLISSGQQKEEFYQNMWKSIKETGGWSGEIWDRRKNGEAYPQWLSINAVVNPDGILSHYVGVFTDISNIKETERKLEHLAFRDALTGLPNRQLFQDRLKHEIARTHRDESRIALIFLDLDKFKQVNDSLGHHIGDELLQSIAKRIQNNVRDDDTVARLGGDEFTIILTSISSTSTAADIAEKIIEVVKQPIILHGHEIFIGASIGISLYPGDATSEGSMIRNADAAMYHAKETGRGNFKFFSEEINQLNQHRRLLENNLRRAIKNQEFEVYYQPQINITTNKVIGSEALIRWNDPHQGLISPADFIPIAEDTGLILEIGAWVFKDVCEQLRRDKEAGIDSVRVAINLSAVQFRDDGLLEMISSTIKNNNVATELIEIEITESAIMENANEAIVILEKLSSLGLRISIDAFGTGYSSMAYLKKFPVDQLKIDREFICDLPNDSDDAILTTTMINLANSLGIEALAEGVETKEQIEFLRDQGCRYVQGYYYSRPLPHKEFSAYISSIS